MTISRLNARVHGLLTSFSMLTLSACGTLPNGHGWGQDASFTPSTQRVTKAALNAATHPATWMPLMGAAVLSMGNLDEKYTQALAEHTPVFGSQQDANHASDILRSTLVASTIVTGLATPSGTTQSEIIANKSKGLLTEYAILETTSAATGQIKRGTGRERPNGLNNSSFPSGHTSKAFAAAALTSKNLDSLPISSSSAQTIRLGLYTVACGTGLARVEANMHYLTDVMAGAALGNFLSRFIHDAFLGLDDINHQLVIEISSHYSYLDLSWNF